MGIPDFKNLTLRIEAVSLAFFQFSFLHFYETYDRMTIKFDKKVHLQLQT